MPPRQRKRDRIIAPFEALFQSHAPATSRPSPSTPTHISPPKDAPSGYIIKPGESPTSALTTTSTLGEVSTSGNINEPASVGQRTSDLDRIQSPAPEETPPPREDAPSLGFKARVSVGFEALKATLKVIERGADVFTPLKSVVGGILGVIQVVEMTRQNNQDYRDLEQKLTTVVSIINNHAHDRSSRSADRLESLSMALSHQIEAIRSKYERVIARRAAEIHADAVEIASSYRTLSSLFDVFLIDTALGTENTVENILLNTSFDNLPVAKRAAYNASSLASRSACTAKTRETLLADLEAWALDADNTRLYWLNGMAGTGKTTIAYTLCKLLDRMHLLGGSFFCSHLDTDSSDAKLIFPTLGYDLASRLPAASKSLLSALTEDRHVGYKTLRDQFDNLIVKLSDAAFTNRQMERPRVIVIDSLDECSERRTVGDLISILCQSRKHLHLKFLVTSRPEQHIENMFKRAGNVTVAPRSVPHQQDDEKGDVTADGTRTHDLISKVVTPTVQLVVLQDVDVWKDIEVFLRTELPALGPSTPWPTERDISLLVDFSAGFFIYAATAVKFLEGDMDMAQSRLEILLKKRESKIVSPYADLDMLYLRILRTALPKTSPSNLKKLFQLVVGSLILLFDPISLSAFEKLFNLEEGDAKLALLGLHSVVIVPSSNGEAARPWHPSFHDFLTDDQRCIGANGEPDPRFYVNPLEHHRRIAISCLELLTSSLTKDLCNIRDYSKTNDEVEDLQQVISDNIPSELQYSCMHWTSHVLRTELTDQLTSLLLTFFREYLLFWLEALSLLNKLEFAAKGLLALKQWYSRADELSLLIYDAQRFILSFYDPISTSALHIYQSALLFTPRSPTLFKTYQDKAETSINITDGIERQWNPCLRVLEHPSLVWALASAPDGLRLVTGADDSLVRVWDQETGILILELREHSKAVASVAFSADGAEIASGSWDGEIRVWDAVTYTCTMTLRGHSGSVTSVAFFGSDRQLVSGSWDKTIRIWSPPEQDAVQVLIGHTDLVMGVACCPHSRFIASGSYDTTVRIWDTSTYRPIRNWVINELARCVAFSPDGTLVAAGSKDSKIYLWNIDKDTLVTKMDNHGPVLCVTFWHDGSQLVTGSLDGIVRIFDLEKQELTSALNGHSDAITCVTTSHDGFILTGSDDTSVRIWDPANNPMTTVYKNCHSRMINTVAFSPDGGLIVTTSDDSTALIWNQEMHKPLATLRHEHDVNDAKFFPCGSQVITGSRDKTAGIWKIDGAQSAYLQGHTDSVWCVSVSPTGNYVATGSFDETVRIWEATTYAFVVELRDHEDFVYAVAFSSDGHLVVTGSMSGIVRIWDLPSGANSKVFDDYQSFHLADIAFSSDNTRVIARWTATGPIVWDVATHQRAPPPETQKEDRLITNLADAYSDTIILEKRGWIIVKQGDVRKRVCWIPPTWRGWRAITLYSSKLAIGSSTGEVALLDIGELLL